MKASISKEGVLWITPEIGTEEYAINKWVMDNGNGNIKIIDIGRPEQAKEPNRDDDDLPF